MDDRAANRGACFRRAGAPDAGDRWGVGARAERCEPVHVLDRAQQRVVVDAAGIRPRRDHRAREDRGDRVAWRVGLGLVEGQHQQAVVGAGPVEVAAQCLLRPRIARSDGAVVHVVAQVGGEEGDRRQPVPVGPQRRGGQVGGGAGEVGEVHPRAVLARVPPRRAHRGARTGKRLGVSHERPARGEERGAEVGRVEAVVAAVVGDALGAPREQREVVGLARVGFGVRVGEARPGLGQGVQVGRAGAPEDLAGVLVLHDDDQHVVGGGKGRRGRRGARRGGEQCGDRERDEACDAASGHGVQCGEPAPPAVEGARRVHPVVRCS